MVLQTRAFDLKWRSALFFLGLTLPAACTVAQDGADTPATTTQMLAPETVVAETKQGALTIADLQDYARLAPIPSLRGVPPMQIPRLPTGELKEAAQWIASRKQAEEEMAGADESVRAACIRAYDERRKSVIFDHMIQSELMDKVSTPTQESLEAYYEDHKPEYFQPFSFTMRHLILLTYKPYVVSPEDIEDSVPDALKKISARVNGTPDEAVNIRSDVPGRPLRHEEGKLDKPLTPGEQLLIPMNNNEASTVKARLDGIMQEIARGDATFEKMAETFSESDAGGDVLPVLPSGTRPVLDELINVAKQTEVGAVSAPFHTKHGWQVIQVVSKKEEGHRPLEEVKGEISRILNRQEQDRLAEEFLARLFENPELQIDYELIAKQGDTLSTDTVIARVGDSEVHWAGYKDAWIRNGRATDPNAIKTQLQRNLAMITALAQSWARPQLEAEGNKLSKDLKLLRSAVAGEAYLQRLAVEGTLGKLTPEAESEFYEANKERLFKAPEQAAFRAMELRLSPEESAAQGEELEKARAQLLSKLQEALANVKSADDFKTQADLLNQALSTRGVSAFEFPVPRPLELLPQTYRDELAKLKVGEWSAPFSPEPDRVTSILLTEWTAARQKPMEEVIDQLKKAVYNERLGATLKETETQLAEKAEFKFLLTTGE